NVGTTTLTISGIAITGANAGDIAQTHACGSSLAAGASCAISVTFKPTALGTRSAALSVSDNAAASPQSVALSGSGIAGRCTPRGDRKSVVEGDRASGSKTVTIKKGSTTTLTITRCHITGA